MTLENCPKCGSDNLTKFVSALPINSIDCADCGNSGPNTSDSFGASELAWNKAAGEKT